ncbi:MAG: hypothetical protein ACXWZB_09050 [Gaiellaceae bacterium]
MPRQRSADLFPSDRPLPASQMIGREADVHAVATALVAGTNLVVAGARRTGKTSVCEAALVRAAADGLYTVAVDLFRIPTAAQLAEALVAQTVANRPPLQRLVHAARRAGRFAGEVAERSLTLKAQAELGEEIEIAFRPGLADRDPARYLEYALELPNRIARADGRHVIVFFDEFQEVANPRRPYGDPDEMTKKMRATFQRSDECSFLFAGSVEHLLRGLFAPGDSAFSQFGSFHELAPIAVDAWLEGLSERFAADGCTVRAGALERIVELGEGHPRATMLVAQQTHLTSVMLGMREIDLTLVQQGFEAALEGDRPVHEQAVEHIRQLHRLALVVARRIAAGDPPHAGLNSSESYRSVKALHDAGLVEPAGPRRWKIVNPLLGRYLRELEPYG